ncbi:MAG: PAS domain S-box protein [Aestuariivirga sp.]
MSAPASASTALPDLLFGGLKAQAASGWKIERTVLPGWEDARAAFFPDQNGRVYERLLANLPVMLHAMDRQGRITAVNRHWTQVLGHAPEEAEGRLLTEFLAPGSRQRLLQDIYPAYFLSGILSAEPVDMICRDGSTRSMLLSMNAYRGAKGRIERSVCLVEPAAAVAQAPAAVPHLPRETEALGRIAGGLAHDFNNLLTVIAGNLDLIEGKLPDGDAVMRLREAAGAARKCGGLARQMLALARGGAGPAREVKVNELIAGLLPLLARSLGEAVEVMADLMEGEPRVMADPGRFESVLLDLAEIAREAMQEGGRFSIETHAVPTGEAGAATNGGTAPGPHVLVAVTRTGAPRADEAERARDIAEAFLTRCGGRLTVESRAGGGTAIMMILPRREG